ncbi:hypothetical protein OMD49_30375 [Bacillus anthracis]|nr:hypothetical protein [Bacillus anthracis]
MNITRLSDLQAAVEMTAYARYLAAHTTNSEVLKQAQDAKVCGVRAAHAIGVKKRLFDKLTVARYLEITGSTD